VRTYPAILDGHDCGHLALFQPLQGRTIPHLSAQVMLDELEWVVAKIEQWIWIAMRILSSSFLTVDCSTQCDGDLLCSEFSQTLEGTH
jgi:hypothetical protein